MPRVLVVANQTLGGAYLLEAIKARVAEGPCEITLLVPANPPHQGGSASSSSAWGRAKLQGENLWLPAERDYSQAHQMLEYGLDQFRRVGATVNGDVCWLERLGGHRRRAARAQVRRDHRVHVAQRRLPLDTPRQHRVQRTFRLPVTVITPL
jgi:hypothetical protein